VLTSAQPAVAALVGLVPLDQSAALNEWVGIGVVITTNVLAVTTSSAAGSGSSWGWAVGAEVPGVELSG
jgi:threonine/homoserine efflux transporter RhtA